jgi:serine/threonine protein phosphatase PrpC
MHRRSEWYWCWGGASHPGGRDQQQDRWGVFGTPAREGLLAVVADGMGGHRDGALGAQAVLDAVAQFAREHAAMLLANPPEALLQLCQQCQAAITHSSQLAHSTVVVLWLHADQAHWMHVGDSRLYQLRAGRRLLRTRDHSAAHILLEMGEISEDEITQHPDQNRLYRSLGSEETPKPEIGGSQVQVGDVFVLCSDGAWGHLSETEFWQAATGTEPLSATVATLLEQAVQRSGPYADNATLVLICPHRRRRLWTQLRQWLAGEQYVR